MARGSIKSILVAVLSSILIFSAPTFAQHPPVNIIEKEKEKMDAGEIIVEHVLDAHDFHLLTLKNEHDPKHSKHISIPLPVILYQPGKGVDVFMSSNFHHGEVEYKGYRLLEKEFMVEHSLIDIKNAKGQPVYQAGKIYAVDSRGIPALNVKVYDFSLTKNATQMLLGLGFLLFLLISVAGKYKKGEGVDNAPKGWQNALEPVITFVRDDVARPNLGHQYKKYLPFLLTAFFFILINNLFGLIPGAANVTGNIAFTFVLGIISFIVIMFSTNRHYWKHIFWPPVPHGVKPILIPVEILGIFTKPFALIIRLFANMLAGHIIILSFICLIFILSAMNTGLGWGSSPLFIALAVFIYLLEVLVAFIQAYIFTNLTAVFIGQAFEGGHNDTDGHHDDVIV
ncbi:MAG: F0F1 ATP synthase subunit A [Ferruginibacter sp.]